jgi:hypothetical protein
MITGCIFGREGFDEFERGRRIGWSWSFKESKLRELSSALPHGAGVVRELC